jgi:acetate---CoA ligase (ADP-forming) subunit alpha
MKLTTDLDSLIHPSSIAIIGATEKPGRIGRIIFENLERSGCTLHPVNPKETQVRGHNTFAAPSDLPDNVDLAIITIGAAPAVDAAEACAQRGIPQIVVVAGGFSETGEEGKELERRLAAIPTSFGSRVLGPNTLGIFLPEENLDTIFVEHGDVALAGGGGVAFITQSGSVGVEALGMASNTGFGMRAFVGLGNKCDLGELEFLQYFAEDDNTTCLAFYIESLDSGRQFLEAAMKTSRFKPVIVLKAGRTAAGASAVSSHTGRLAGSDRLVEGALRQFGILRAFDDEELYDAAKTLATLPPAKGNRVAIVTPAGGYGVMGADHVETHHQGRSTLRMAELLSKTRARIKKTSLPFASCLNPVDLTAGANDEMFGSAIDALLEDDGVDIIICAAFFAPWAITDQLLHVVADRIKHASKPVIVFTKYGPFTEEFLHRFHDAGVVGFPSITRAVRAARFLVERADTLKALGKEA